jgi:hypothetical protein
MVLPAYIDAETGEITDGEAWVGIATTTLGSDTASVTFTSTDDGQVGDWSQYMDLVIIWYARCANAGSQLTYLVFRYNNDTGANYTGEYLRGNGSTVVAGDTGGASYMLLGMYPENTITAGTFSSGVTSIFDINSGKYKSCLSQGAGDFGGDGEVRIEASTWKSQASITEIDITQLFGEDHLAGSSFSLFGVLPRMVA